MENSEKLLSEIQNIRNLMERSSRFLSLSGLSGILVGIYALIGAIVAYRIVYVQFPTGYRQEYISDVLIILTVLGFGVLLLSIITVLFLTTKKAKKEQKTIWGPGSKLLLMHLFIPLIAGGLLILVMIIRGYYGVISPCFLIFYGLALVNASKYTRQEIFYLGLIEILLGLVAAIFPDYGLYLWAVGFGIVHIIYGILFISQEKRTKNPVL